MSNADEVLDEVECAVDMMTHGTFQGKELEVLKRILAKREKVRSEPADFDRQIAGGLRDAINAHGPITPPWIASATKRIANAIREELKRERDRIMSSTPKKNAGSS